MADNPIASKPVLTSPLSVSFMPAERGRVRRAAFLAEQSVSAFIRAAAVKAADRRLKQAAQDAETMDTRAA